MALVTSEESFVIYTTANEILVRVVGPSPERKSNSMLVRKKDIPNLIKALQNFQAHSDKEVRLVDMGEIPTCWEE